jgi:protein gp37
MPAKTKIEWTELSWNPVTGCSKISPGCKNCYAERFALRLQNMGNPRYKCGFKVTLHSDLIEAPFHWQKPSLVFVNSMSDLFHETIPFEFIKKVFDVMNRCSHLQFQILTKRSKRMVELSNKLTWSRNIWTGVSIEYQKYIWRILDLQKIPAFIRFVSCEPLLGPIDELPLNGLNWVIVGGESGPGARPMRKEWVLSIRNQCEQKGVPFFFKQWGGVHKYKNGRMLEGKTYNEFPVRILGKIEKKDLTLFNIR